MSSKVESPDARPSWPAPVAEDAYHGLAGEFVHMVADHTESDPMALLTQFIVAVGSVVGRSPHYKVGGTRHGTNLFLVNAGPTGSGRKGTSWDMVREVTDSIDDEWAKNCIKSGLSSGEGLIWCVRDPIEKNEPVKQGNKVTEYQLVVTDEGVADKRVLIMESELAGALKVLSREGNTLSAVLRSSWDGSDLSSLTKNSPAKASNPHISVIGHITIKEVVRLLSETEMANGFGNRFLWICTRRSKLLPEGGQVPTGLVEKFTVSLQAAVAAAKHVGEVGFDIPARAYWHHIYTKLANDRGGLVGDMMGRSAPILRRIAMIYALLDCEANIQLPHLKAAEAIIRYSEASCASIFGDAVGNPMADDLLRELRARPRGMTRTEIRDFFNRNKSAQQISAVLLELERQGLAVMSSVSSDGRPVEIWSAQAGPTTLTTLATKPDGVPIEQQ